MHFVPRWPRPNDLSFSKDEQSQNEYFRSILLWASENGGEEYLFLSLEEWPVQREHLSQKETFSLREDSSLPENLELSFLLPPVLFGHSLVFWLGEPKSLAYSYFQILEKLKEFRKHASELLDQDFSPEPKLVWKEEIGVSHSVLLADTLWEKKDAGKRVSTPLSFSQTFFLGSLFGVEKIDSIQWVKEGDSEIEAAVFEFIATRAGSKYGNVLSTLGKVSQKDIWEYTPHPYFSLPFHLLIQAAVMTEAWSQLVSLWIEERPRKEEALVKLEEWTKRETSTLTTKGFESLFEERSVLLVDKYAGRSDRFLLQSLEKEYFSWKQTFELESLHRRKEIDENLIPSVLARVSSHSQFSWPPELSSEWEEIGKTYRQSLENLLVERKKIAVEIPTQDGKTAESWNVLLSYRSE